MLGYTVPSYGRLSPSDFLLYRRYYCEGCHQLKAGYGLRGTLTVNYDMTFNAILLNGIAGDVTDFEGTTRKLCVFEKPKADSDILRAMAAYTLIITKWELADDENDKPSRKSKLISEVLAQAIGKAVREYPEYDEKVGEGFRRLVEMEEADTRDAKALGREFGRYLAMPLRDMAGDHGSDDLDRVFQELTSAVYVMDALDDLEQDYMDGTFNAYLPGSGFINSEDFVSKNIYALSEDVRGVMDALQSSYLRVRGSMRANASLCDNIVYYGIPESAAKVLRGESQAKASIKNCVANRKERLSDARSAGARRVVVVADVHRVHLQTRIAASPGRVVPAVLAASRPPPAAPGIGLGGAVLGGAYPDFIPVDAQSAGPAFPVALVHLGTSGGGTPCLDITQTGIR